MLKQMWKGSKTYVTKPPKPVKLKAVLKRIHAFLHVGRTMTIPMV